VEEAVEMFGVNVVEEMNKGQVLALVGAKECAVV
jgi:hypothetical protein